MGCIATPVFAIRDLLESLPRDIQNISSLRNLKTFFQELFSHSSVNIFSGAIFVLRTWLQESASIQPSTSHAEFDNFWHS